jgi:predicted nuclease of restriction endonuclease-like (RecB) superfamily
MDKSTLLPDGYPAFLTDLKRRIRESQLRASLSVNRELVLLYWQIGREILARQTRERWGAKVIDRLATDLKQAFPEMKGFSPRNLKYMRAFAESWPELAIVQQVVAQIPWGHQVRLLEQVKDPGERDWYVRATIQHGWSRDVLVHQIATGLCRRSGKAVTNFETTLPPLQSDLAQQITKDPYTFDFLSLGEEAQERDLERGLLGQLRRFLLELGVGFAFVGSQYRLVVGQSEFFLDLLFYHLRLRCYVVVDLKTRSFQPEFAGKMNFYLAAVDDQLRHRDDQPSIGLIICKTKDEVVAEYALRNTRAPIGISEYTLAKALSDNYRGSLPTVEELESELGAERDED